jgi:hypothetical protein
MICSNKGKSISYFNGNSTVVEHLPRKPKVLGSSAATDAGTGRENVHKHKPALCLSNIMVHKSAPNFSSRGQHVLQQCFSTLIRQIDTKFNNHGGYRESKEIIKII